MNETAAFGFGLIIIYIFGMLAAFGGLFLMIWLITKLVIFPIIDQWHKKAAQYSSPMPRKPTPDLDITSLVRKEIRDDRIRNG